MSRIVKLATGVRPDFDAVGGAEQLRHLVGALLTFSLLIAALMVVVCAAVWGLASAHGSWRAAGRAKTGLLVAVGGAALAGGMLAWLNWLLDVGASL